MSQRTLYLTKWCTKNTNKYDLKATSILRSSSNVRKLPRPQTELCSCRSATKKSESVSVAIFLDPPTSAHTCIHDNQNTSRDLTKNVFLMTYVTTIDLTWCVLNASISQCLLYLFYIGVIFFYFDFAIWQRTIVFFSIKQTFCVTNIII